MTPPADSRPSGPIQRAAAWMVHVLTASGALWGLLALRAVDAGDYRLALLWNAAAVAVDGLDGPLARRFEVRRRIPQIDGALLDNVMDYLNYVVVPAYLVLRAGFLPDGLGWAAAAAICFTSAFQFTHREAKTSDLYFRGFPSYWNVVAAYFVLLRPSPLLAGVTVAVLGVLVFVPLRFIYPSRTPTLRWLTLALTATWSAAMLWLVFELPRPSRGLLHASLLYPLYYLVLSLVLTLRAGRRHGDTP